MKENKVIGIGIIGCGLIGSRRAHVALRHPKCRLIQVADIDEKKAKNLARETSCHATRHWKEVIQHPEIQAVNIAVPNRWTMPIILAALRAGKHVLAEKPMGRNLSEAVKIADAAKKSKRVLMIGLNLRYHPAVRKAHALCQKGLIGRLINIRCFYGHGGRPGYEKEWRSNPSLSGGGELLDQGIHLIDLIRWFAGMPRESFAFLQTAFWPVQPLEDNAFGLFRYRNGLIASLHASWTQWKNRFSFELFGNKGSLSIEGLGKSYGPERLRAFMRNRKGGPPTLREWLFEDNESSWKEEWNAFLQTIQNGKKGKRYYEEALQAMKAMDALYQSARMRRIVHV